MGEIFQVSKLIVINNIRNVIGSKFIMIHEPSLLLYSVVMKYNMCTSFYENLLFKNLKIKLKFLFHCLVLLAYNKCNLDADH